MSNNTFFDDSTNGVGFIYVIIALAVIFGIVFFL
jgi:hypothetical protein